MKLRLQKFIIYPDHVLWVDIYPFHGGYFYVLHFPIFIRLTYRNLTNGRVTNMVDLGQLASQNPTHLDLNCF